MKISIFSFAVNDLFPLDIVHRQFTKYIEEDFDFILFNDAFDSQMEQNINTIAQYNKINYVRVPQNIHSSRNPSIEYANTLNWAVQDYAINNGCDIIVLMHCDVFPIYKTSILNIIEDNIVASTIESKVLADETIHYFYPAFTIINMKLLKNANELDFGLEAGLDCGGKTKEFIKNNKLVKFIGSHQTSNIVSNSTGKSFSEIDLHVYRSTNQHARLLNDSLLHFFETNLNICKDHSLSAGWVAEGFYHYIAGSQWNASERTSFAEGHKKRMELFLKYFY